MEQIGGLYNIMAKQFIYTNPTTGQVSEFFRCPCMIFNLRSGQESFTFWFDGYKDFNAFLAGKSPCEYLEVKVPQADIVRFARLHLIDKKTVVELSRQAFEEFSGYPNAVEITDPLFTQLSS